MKLQSNGVRTAIIHALMHTRGTLARPWNKELRLGAVDKGNGIEVLLKSDEAYQGKLVFDIPRHREYMGFRRNWPRMNTLPEWFTVEADKRYQVGSMGTFTGKQLAEGIAVQLEPGENLRVTVALEESGQ
jgi:hypothetical protein